MNNVMPKTLTCGTCGWQTLWVDSDTSFTELKSHLADSPTCDPEKRVSRGAHLHVGNSRTEISPTDFINTLSRGSET